MSQTIRRALISVSDKRNVVDFARFLADSGVEILSTGGTATLLSEEGVPVVEVGDHTGFPEMMDGRVKTLHPKIHGGILGRRGVDDETMELNQIPPIDLVIVNLYPFKKTVLSPECTLENAIENIDIGGPTMLRAAAKNFSDVTVVVDIDDYPRISTEMERNNGVISSQIRFDLAVKAFEHTAAYDGQIANYLGKKLASESDDQFSRTFNTQLIKKQDMRYGENPHQNAAFYIDPDNHGVNLASASQLQGKELSYNNIADTDAALECVKQFESDFACAIVKHANPCGVAVADSQLKAYQNAYSTDSESAFGGIIAFNSQLQGKTAEAIVNQQFVEVIIAPEISDDAKWFCSTKDNVRVLETGVWRNNDGNDELNNNVVLDYKKVSGGLLVQEMDVKLFDNYEIVTQRQPTDKELDDMVFAWKVAKFVKSNAIVYAANQMTLGVGAGQMSRVNSARIAAIKAEHASFDLHGAVMASDAFFPFRDGLDNAASVGIKSVIQPGGSMRDDEVIAAADEHGIAMVFTGMRHFRH